MSMALGVGGRRGAQLRLGAIPSGVASDHNEWLHPDLPSDASIDIDWLIGAARRRRVALLADIPA